MRIGKRKKENFRARNIDERMQFSNGLARVRILDSSYPV